MRPHLPRAARGAPDSPENPGEFKEQVRARADRGADGERSPSGDGWWWWGAPRGGGVCCVGSERGPGGVRAGPCGVCAACAGGGEALQAQ